MIIENGDVWSIYDQSDLFIITMNEGLNWKGQLEIDQRLQDRVQDIDKLLAKKLRYNFYGDTYGLVILKRRPRPSIGMFQIGTNNKTNLSIVTLSMLKLKDIAKTFSQNRFDLYYPTISKRAKKIINKLPKNVHIWSDN